MVEIFKISKTFVITFFIFSCCDILLYIFEIQSAVLPKFISASYMENLEFQFNSILLNTMKKYIDTHFNGSSSLLPNLVGDLPIYDKSKNYIQSSYFDIKEEQKKILNEIKLNKNYKAKIPISNDSKYFLFPNSDKTKMYIIIFYLEKIKKTPEHDKTNNYFFTKLSKVSLYEISINNFIINYQIEFSFKYAFFKQNWKIDIPGIIMKHSFSNDYEQLVLVYKNIINNNQLKYNLVYIDIKKGEFNNNFYDFIELTGNLKINSLAVKKNLIIYSRKYDLYKLNFLFKNNDNNQWINTNQEKIDPFLEPFNIIADLKFITDNSNINRSNYYEKNTFLLIKGIKCNETGIQLYMNLSNINYVNLFNKNTNNKLISEKISFLTEFLPPALFERKNYDVFDKNYTFNMDNLEIFELNERLKDFREPMVFNKYLQKNNEPNFLSYIFLSSLSTYFHILLNDNYFYNITENDYNEDLFLIRSEEKIYKICGKDYYVIEYGDNKLSLGTSKSFDKKNKNKENENATLSLDIRRISFVDLPKVFKPNKILDYYFDFFNDKLILILLINDGELVSLDFSKLILNKNNSGTFLLDNMNSQKFIMFFISCFLIFIYSVEFTYSDQLSIHLRDWVFRYFNGQSNQNNNIDEINQINNRNEFGNETSYDYGENLSNSSFSFFD